MKSINKIIKKPVSCILLALLLFSQEAVYAAPQGAQVINGQVSFQQEGNLTEITASHQSIIHYQSFDIAQPETVRFIQPGVNATVLNRITGSQDPTQIHGQLLANGQVYLVNPAGIMFGQNALVDVGGLYAAAGNISDENFINRLNKFSELKGIVQNSGDLSGDFIFLMGQHVVNHGNITSGKNTVALLAGEEVLIGEQGDYLFIKSETPIVSDKAGVKNTGKIEALGGKVYFGAGDLYALAIKNSGIIQATAVKLEGGNGSLVEVSGTIDASNTTSGETGGRIEVLGEKIALREGTRLNASGDIGGGTILVGGDFQGNNPDVRNAKRTFVAEGVTLKADALTNGDGGKVIIWADEVTGFIGNIFARGGELSGDGGFAEVSGKEHLLYRGFADLTALQGKVGQLLLDPAQITIVEDTPATHDPELIDNQILSADSGSTAFTLSNNAIVNSLATANTLIQNNDDAIIINAPIITTTSNTLTIEAVDDIAVNAAITLSGTGGIDLIAGAMGGAGDIIIDQTVTVGGSIQLAGQSIIANAPVTASGGGDIILQGNDLFLASGSSIQGADTLTIYPLSESTTIGLGDNVTGTLRLDSAELSRIADGFTSVTFGDAVNTAAIDLGDVIFTDPVTVIGGSITGNGTIDGAVPLTLKSAGVITLNAAVGSITPLSGLSFTGDGTEIHLGTNITLSDSDLTFDRDIILTNDVTLSTSSGVGNVTFNNIVNGQDSAYDLTVTAGMGDVIFDGLVGGNDLIGNITVSGQTIELADFSGDIESVGTVLFTALHNIVLGQNTSIATTDGDITLMADQGITQPGDFAGIELNGAAITTDNGNIFLQGRGGDSSNDFQNGIFIGSGSFIQSNDSGDITLLGTGAGTGSSTDNHGVNITGISLISVNNGNMNITGTSGVGDSAGVLLFGPFQSLIFSNGTGDITITGAGNGNFDGIHSYPSNIIGGFGAAGDINLISDTIHLPENTVQSTGALTIRPLTPSTTIGLGDSAMGTLQLDASELASFLDGFSSIVFGDVTNTAAVTMSNVTFNDPTTITGTSITHNGTLDGAVPLTLQSADAIALNSPIGSTIPLTRLTLSSIGLNFSLGTDVTLNDSPLIIESDVRMTDNLALNTGNGDITLEGAINGSFELTLNTTGVVNINNAIGGNDPLTGFDFLGLPSIVNIGADITLDDTSLVFNSPVLLNDSIAIDTGSGDLVFNHTLDDDNDAVTSSALTLISDGVIAIHTTVGGIAAIDRLETNGNGVVEIGADLNVSGGTLVFNTDILLTDSVHFSDTGDSGIFFNGNIDSDGNGDYNLALTTSASSITEFNGTVGANNAIGSLMTSATGITEINGGAIVTTGIQTYQGVVSLGANTTLKSDASITFNSALDGGNNNSGLTIEGNVTFNDLVGGSSSLGTLSITGITTLNSGRINTIGNQQYRGAVNLSTDTALITENEASLLFTSIVGSSGTARELDVTGSTQFEGAVGNNGNGLKHLIINGNTEINGGEITTEEEQEYRGDIVLGADTLFTSTNDDEIIFWGKVESDASVTETFGIDIDGAARFEDTVGASKPLNQLHAQGNTQLNGASVATNEMQQFDGAVTLGADVTLKSDASITFNSTLDSENSNSGLTIEGNVTFNDLVGGNSSLGALAITGTTIINSGGINTLRGQSYGGGITLGASTLLRSINGDEIAFLDNIESDNSVSESFDLDIDADARFEGIVGQTRQLRNLRLRERALLNGGTINTLEQQQFDGEVTLGAPTRLNSNIVLFNDVIKSAQGNSHALTIDADVVFNDDAGIEGVLESLVVLGNTTINNCSIVTEGSQNYAETVIIGEDTQLISQNGDAIVFNGTVENRGEANDLSIEGNITFNAPVGGSDNALGNLAVIGDAQINGGSVVTQGNQDFEGNIALGMDTNFEGETVRLGGDIEANGHELLINGNALFGGSLSNLGNFNVTGDFGFSGNSEVVLNNPLTFDRDISVTGAVTFVAPEVSFEGVVEGNDNLELGVRGNTVFQEEVVNLRRLEINGDVQIGGGLVDTVEDQTYNGLVTISPTTDTVLQGDNLNFMENIDGGNNNLTLDGLTELDGAIGNTNRLIFNDQVSLNANVITQDQQIYNGPVTLEAESGPVMLETQGSTIIFNDSLNSETSDLAILAINTNGSRTEINGAVGQSQPLAQLTIDGETQIGASVSTEGTQEYNGIVLLDAPSDGISLSSNGQSIIFNQTIDSIDNQNANLNIDSAGGAIALNADIGSERALGAFILNGSTQLNANINTEGNQFFNGAVTLNSQSGTVSLQTTGQDITFSQTIDSSPGNNVNLTIDTQSGDVDIQGDIGSNNPVGQLSLNATNITLHDVTSIGDQNYANTVNTPDGAIVLNSTYISRQGTIRFNAASDSDIGANSDPVRADSVPDRATIYKTSAGDVTIIADNFIMGKNEKLTVADGNLVIDVGNGQAIVGDLNASETITITGNTIILGRSGGSNLLADSTISNVIDSGTDIIAEQVIFNGSLNVSNIFPQQTVFVATMGGRALLSGQSLPAPFARITLTASLENNLISDDNNFALDLFALNLISENATPQINVPEFSTLNVPELKTLNKNQRFFETRSFDYYKIDTEEGNYDETFHSLLINILYPQLGQINRSSALKQDPIAQAQHFLQQSFNAYTQQTQQLTLQGLSQYISHQKAQPVQTLKHISKWIQKTKAQQNLSALSQFTQEVLLQRLKIDGLNQQKLLRLIELLTEAHENNEQNISSDISQAPLAMRSMDNIY